MGNGFDVPPQILRNAGAAAPIAAAHSEGACEMTRTLVGATIRGVMVLMLVTPGCAQDPTCKVALERTAEILDLRASEITAQIDICQKEAWSVATRRCLANAKNKSALDGCKAPLALSASRDPREPIAAPTPDGTRAAMKMASRSEAMVQLDKIGKRAVEEHTTNAAFPAAAASTTPTTPCCTQNAGGAKRCAANASDWSSAAWRALDFSLDKDHLFQYSYSAGRDGQTFVARAISDLDCDGVVVTYELRGKVVGGTPVASFHEPAPGAD